MEDDGYTLLETLKEAMAPRDVAELDAEEHEENEEVIHEAEDDQALNDVEVERRQGYSLRDRNAIKVPARYVETHLSVSLAAESDEPCTYEDAVSCDEATLWKQAMNEDHSSRISRGLSPIRRTTRRSSTIGGRSK